MTPTDIREQVAAALAAFVAFVSDAPASPLDGLDALNRRYSDLKSKQGRASVAGKVGFNDAELTAFDATLREAVRRLERLPSDADESEERNAIIAGLRLLSWLETVSAKTPGFDFQPRLPQRDEEVGRKQVRALELILRSVVTNRYGDQDKLIARLKELLSEKVVQQWMASGDRGDVLSGSNFSDLASLFVSAEEFPGYDPLYRETPWLTLFKEKRVTIRNFLDDVRRIRNVLAHNKRITPLQVNLLSLYYDEIVEPLQEAFDQGRSDVNPETFLDVSKEELEGWFGGLKEDLKGVRDDIAELRADLVGRLDALAGDTKVLRQETAQVQQTAFDIRGDTTQIRADTHLLKGDTKEIIERTRLANRRLRTLVPLGVVALVGIGAIGWLVFGQGKKTDEIAQTTQATQRTAEATQASAERIEASQARTEQAIADIAAGFAKIDKAGGVIQNASRPEEHYHNAIVYEERGDAAAARKEYMAFAESDVDAIDVYERFARLLRAQDGRAGAREVFGELARRLTAPSIKFVYAMSFEDAERTRRMTEFMDANKDFGPGYYLLAQEYSIERRGSQSVSDKRRMLSLLKEFLKADEAGTLVSRFVDQQVLGRWLDDARQAVKNLEAELQASRSTPAMTQSRNNAGWVVYFQIPEAALKIFYRLGDDPNWSETGPSGNVDQRTGQPAPQPFITLPNDQGPTKIHLKYTDQNGEEVGPFEYEFGTSSPLAEEQKRLLEMTWTSWVVIQPNPGDASQTLVYFTHLVSYRCGIETAVYGFDGGPLDKTFDLPPCDEANPMAMPPDFMPMFEPPPGITTMQVQVTYKDGTQSPVREYKPTGG